MTGVALSQVYWYFALDVDHDVSGDVMSLSLDQVAWVTATYAAPSAALQAKAAAKTPVAEGFVRYWWRIMAGSGGSQLPLVYGPNVVHGRLVDTPETVYTSWGIQVPRD